MSFGLVRQTWNSLTALFASEMAQLDQNVSNALDGAGGGSYAPSAKLLIGGGGIMDANSATHDVASSTANVTISGVTAHRLRVTNAFNVTEKLEVQFDAGADGEKRELQLDFLSAGTQLLVKGDGGATIASGLFWANRTLRYVSVTLERDGGAWHIATRSASPDAPFLTTSLTPVQTPSVNTQMVTSEYVYANTASGSISMRLPDAADIGNGVFRTIRFERIDGGTQLGFHNPAGSLQYLHLANGAGEVNTTFTFVSRNSGWTLWGLRRNERDLVAGIAYTNPSSAEINTDAIDAVYFDLDVSPFGYNEDTTVSLYPPLFEGQELAILWRLFRDDATATNVHFITTANANPFFTYRPKNTLASGPMTWRLRVVNGQWRWAGASY